jgi:hypothetical protein
LHLRETECNMKRDKITERGVLKFIFFIRYYWNEKIRTDCKMGGTCRPSSHGETRNTNKSFVGVDGS